MSHPILDPLKKSHTDGPYHDAEVGLAHRNHGLLLEGLRHDLTPAGMHYLLIHFDVPYVADPSAWTLAIGGLSSDRSHCRSPISPACRRSPYR
jgi:hypothetical protein